MARWSHIIHGTLSIVINNKVLQRCLADSEEVIIGDIEEKEKDSGAKSSASPTKTPNATSPIQSQMPAIQPNVSHKDQQGEFKQGLLAIKLLECWNLKMPAEHSQLLPGGPTGKDLSMLPLAIIEIDKNEVIMRSVEANPATSVVQFQTKANL